MPITRRQFVKRSAGMVSLSLLMPRVLLTDAQAQSANRRIFVVIQLGGGNDGLNTLIPYTDPTYHTKRPTLGFHDTELVDSQGKSMILDSQFGLHPALTQLKDLYDANRVAIINGVGYPNPNLSHFTSMDIWHTAKPTSPTGTGWLGRYADEKLAGQSGLVAASIGTLPKSLYGDNVVVPSISSFQNYTYQTDGRFAGDRNNQINTFNANNNRVFDAESFAETIAEMSVDAVAGAAQVQAAVATYTSTVTYPAAPNPLSAALKMAAQLITTLPQANLLYVQMGGFDNHSAQIQTQGGTNKLAGAHFTLLRYFAEAVKAFYDDMAAHGLADNTLMMEWSEFGRRPNENASFGTDHGTSSQMIVIGNPVLKGVYGQQPSLTDLDGAGNLKFKVDFREVYATILNKWLGADAQEILGGSFADVGFLG
ncbi:MAG: DUF1501 domain-containing protein [Acidobacteriota bacterium]